MGSLSSNLQRFGMERVAKLESLQEIIAEMNEGNETSENSHPDDSNSTAQAENDG